MRLNKRDLPSLTDFPYELGEPWTAGSNGDWGTQVLHGHGGTQRSVGVPPPYVPQFAFRQAALVGMARMLTPPTHVRTCQDDRGASHILEWLHLDPESIDPVELERFLSLVLERPLTDGRVGRWTDRFGRLQTLSPTKIDAQPSDWELIGKLAMAAVLHPSWNIDIRVPTGLGRSFGDAVVQARHNWAKVSTDLRGRLSCDVDAQVVQASSDGPMPEVLTVEYITQAAERAHVQRSVPLLNAQPCPPAELLVAERRPAAAVFAMSPRDRMAIFSSFNDLNLAVCHRLTAEMAAQFSQECTRYNVTALLVGVVGARASLGFDPLRLTNAKVHHVVSDAQYEVGYRLGVALMDLSLMRNFSYEVQKPEDIVANGRGVRRGRRIDEGPTRVRLELDDDNNIVMAVRGNGRTARSLRRIVGYDGRVLQTQPFESGSTLLVLEPRSFAIYACAHAAIDRNALLEGGARASDVVELYRTMREELDGIELPEDPHDLLRQLVKELDAGLSGPGLSLPSAGS